MYSVNILPSCSHISCKVYKSTLSSYNLQISPLPTWTHLHKLFECFLFYWLISSTLWFLSHGTCLSFLLLFFFLIYFFIPCLLVSSLAYSGSCHLSFAFFLLCTLLPPTFSGSGGHTYGLLLPYSRKLYLSHFSQVQAWVPSLQTKGKTHREELVGVYSPFVACSLGILTWHSSHSLFCRNLSSFIWSLSKKESSFPAILPGMKAEVVSASFFSAVCFISISLCSLISVKFKKLWFVTSLDCFSS